MEGEDAIPYLIAANQALSQAAPAEVVTGADASAEATPEEIVVEPTSTGAQSGGLNPAYLTLLQNT